MEFRKLGASGFMVPALTLGTGTFGGGLTAKQMAALDAASRVTLPYPYWRQRGTFVDRNPPAI